LAVVDFAAVVLAAAAVRFGGAFAAVAFGADALVAAVVVFAAAFVAGAVLAADLVAGAVARPALAVAARREVVVWAATDRFAAPAFAVPVDTADDFAARVPVLVVWLLVVWLLLVVLAVVWLAARLAAGPVVALSVAAIVSSPLCRRLPLVVGELRRLTAPTPIRPPSGRPPHPKSRYVLLPDRAHARLPRPSCTARAG
jgi:hypothetical protein